MRIKFSGIFELDDDQLPDDRGSIDIWLLRFIKDAIEEGPGTDDIYDKLQLEWEEDELE